MRKTPNQLLKDRHERATFKAMNARLNAENKPETNVLIPENPLLPDDKYGKVKVSDVYVGFNQAGVGGYLGKKGKDVTVSADFVDNEKIIAIAKQQKLKSIHLAGDWSATGHQGYGEKVSIETAENLVTLMQKNPDLNVRKVSNTEWSQKELQQVSDITRDRLIQMAKNKDKEKGKK
jgi:hypothetical protein